MELVEQVVAEKVRVLAVIPHPEDRDSLHDIFSGSNWQLESVGCHEEAACVLRETLFPVVLCEDRLPDGDWRNVLECVRDLDCPPHLVVLTGWPGDLGIWAEVLHLGGYDVLVKPLEPREIFHVIAAAWLQWKAAKTRAGSSRARQ